MVTVNITVTDDAVQPEIYLGRQGEKQAREIVFDLSALREKYGAGTATLYHQRSKDPAPYLIAETTGTTLTWTVSETDTVYAGIGYCEFRYTFGTEGLSKSTMFATNVKASLSGDVIIPAATQAWYDALVEYIDEHCIAQDQLTQAVADYIDAHPLEGIPSGGTEGQVLVKASGTDFDAEWGDDLSDLKSATSELKENQYKVYATATASGSIASFPDGADDIPVKDLTVAIEPVQSGSGDPSPDNVRLISGWDAVTVTRTGKNLLPTASYKKHQDITYSVKGDGSVSVSGTATGASFSDIGRNETTLKAGTYAVSIGDQSQNVAVTVYKNTSPAIVIRNNAGSFTLDSETSVFVRLSVANGDTASGTVYPQLELGSTATSYEPYNASTISVTFPSEAGTVYGGMLDVTSGVLTVDMVDQNLGNNTTWVYSSDGDYFKCVINDVSTASERIYLCSNYKIIKWTQSASELANAPDKTAYYQRSNKNLFIKDSSYGTDVAALKAAMSGVQLVYELATPIEYDLTPTEVRTLLAQNNIWADCGDSTVEYRADTKLYIDKKIAALAAAMN